MKEQDRESAETAAYLILPYAHHHRCWIHLESCDPVIPGTGLDTLASPGEEMGSLRDYRINNVRYFHAPLPQSPVCWV